MKKLKRLLTAVCSLALVVALAVGNMGLVAYAVTGGGEDNADFKLDTDIVTSVAYGEQFDVATVDGFTVTVTDPSGKEVEVSGGKVTADQLGNYMISYTQGDMEYTFKVNSTMGATYDLTIGEVINGVLYAEADIPSYANVDREYIIPAAYLSITEDGKTTIVRKVEPQFTGVAVTETANGYEFDAAGTVFVRYETTVDGGSKVVSKNYEIQVQQNLEDDTAPTMTVTSFPKTAQLNSKLTLPKATVTDDYDKVVRVEITVIDPDGNAVTSATVDEETGYATAYGEDVLYFDNAGSKTYASEGEVVMDGLYFYPQTKGDYKVTYKAIDDSGNEADMLEYTIAASDGRAPVISYSADKVPTNWGWNTVTNIEGQLEGNTILFGMPEFYDNDTATADIVVTLTITDPNGRTVVRFDNINTDGDVTYTSTNSIFETAPTYTFVHGTGFEFDVKKYVEDIMEATADNDTTYVVTGNYSVVYTAKDTTGNTASTATYYINMVEDYVDETEPTVTINNAPERVVVRDGLTFTVPTASFYSREDSNLTTSYQLVSGEASIDVESEEVLNIEGGKIGDLEITTDTVTLVAKATSDAGNVTETSITINVVRADSKEMNYDVVLVRNESADLRNGIGEINYGTIKIGDITEAEIKNVGVELGIKDSEGTYLSQFGAEIYWADNTKIVRNITFVPSAAGTYYLEVRVFDIYGNNSVRIYPIEIEQKENSGTIESGPSAGTLPTSANIYSTVELVNKNFTLTNVGTYLDTDEQQNVYIATAHEITGGRFSLMGEDLVMMTTGTYRITDRPVIVSKADYTADYLGTNPGYEAWLNSYAIENKSIVANQDTTIVFETVGTSVPAYSEEVGAAIKLPAMIAYNSVENAKKGDVTVKVTHTSGVEMRVTNNDDGTYTFTPNANGAYTVEYTAVVGGTSSTSTYTIKVGDITAPEFTVPSHSRNAKIGDTFQFNAITCSESGVTVLKTLTKDGSTLLTIRSLSGRGEYTFETAGTYEVKYEVTDRNGNTSTRNFTIVVTEASGNVITPIMAITIAIVVIVVALIAGIVIYLIVSRKKKTK